MAMMVCLGIVVRELLVRRWGWETGRLSLGDDVDVESGGFDGLVEKGEA